MIAPSGFSVMKPSAKGTRRSAGGRGGFEFVACLWSGQTASVALGFIVRVTRPGMREAMGLDFVKFARAKVCLAATLFASTCSNKSRCRLSPLLASHGAPVWERNGLLTDKDERSY